MKLLPRKKLEKTAPTKAHTKSHKNELPSDEYKDLIPPVEIPLDETGKIVISVKRGGEFGLPKVDIRLYVDNSVYTGFTKKGINFNLDKLPDLNSMLFEVSEMCEKLKLFDEFEEGDSEEEKEE